MSRGPLLRCASLSVLWIAVWAMNLGVASAQQSAPQAPPPAQPPAQPAEPSTPHGKVIFSRSSADADSAADAKDEAKSTVKATDAQRLAVTFTAYDLDVRLHPGDHTIEVSAQLTVRNDSDQPLLQIPLQLSSTLRWESIAAAGKPLSFGHALLRSDADHTGQVNEAVVALPQPLAPGREITLKTIYSGAIELTAQRLEGVGSPGDLAHHSEWDQVSADFIGLRGFGDVLWYPASSVPVALGDGARLFTEIGRQKLRQTAARVSMRVVAEFFDEGPSVAVLDGHVVPITRTASPEASFPGVVTCSLPATALGFASPSLFLLARAEQEQGNVQIYSRPQNQANTAAYFTAAASAGPLAAEWLGGKSREPLVLIDLADIDDAPFEDGNVLFAGLSATDPEQIAGALSHAWSHASFQSPRPWLQEGVAQFIGNLWLEHSKGRNAALERMEATRSTLALAEPADPGAAQGQALVNASDSAYYRIKAAYVFWMLRGLAGDTALSAALRAYVPAEDTRPEYFEELLERASGKNLRWFFDSWVYQDRGLPDLAVTNVFPTRGSGSAQYLVAVDVANDGYADVEVPVTVRSLTSSVTETVRILGRSKATHRFSIEGAPTEVLVNDGTVPEVQASIHQQTLRAAAP